MGRILVIRGGAIGDFVLTLPAIGLLRENFPDAWIEILGYRHIIALAEGRYYANASRSIEYGPLARFFAPKVELDPELSAYFASFNQVISYLFDPDSFEANLRRCGVKNLILASPKLDDSDHAANQLARPLQELALFLEEPGPRLYPSEQDFEEADRFLGGKKDFAFVHPGSGGERKNWPLESWIELAKRLQPEALVICEGEADAAKGSAVVAQTPGAALAKNLSLPTLAAIISRAKIYVGHDTGISHIAAATGVPCVLLFGPTDPEVWAPANPNVQVVSAPESGLSGLQVDLVTAAVRQLL